MKFTPAADNLTTASLGLGSGTGRSVTINASGPPVCFTWIAFMGELDSALAQEVSAEASLIFNARGGARNPASVAISIAGYTARAEWWLCYTFSFSCKEAFMAENKPQSFASHK